MPNWCENNLTIYGPKDEMQKILDVISVDGSYMLLDKLYPTPEELEIGDVPMVPDERQIANHKKYGYKSWYDWRVDKWGTKWSESDLSLGQEYTVQNGRGVITFNFETAWAPPIEAFNKIAQDYPSLLFCLYYEEPGMGFCGTNVWMNGECVESSESELINRYFDEDYLYDQYAKNG